MTQGAKSRDFQIQVPASIANLGAGFDTLAVAVRLYLRLDVKTLAGENELRFEFLNQKLDGENYIERAFRFLARQNGRCFPSVHVAVTSEIPMRSGLGSSAAATVAGLRLYEALMGPLNPHGLLNAATALEGHPDNAAAALFGGLAASCQLPDGSVFAVRLCWPESLALVVLTPNIQLATSAARSVLPAMVARKDAVFNLQRTVMLVHALQSGDYSLLREALQDRLHQPFRARLVPGLDRMLALEHADLLGVCLSGAGPSMVALAQRNVGAIEELLSTAYASVGVPFQLRRLRAHQSGHEYQRTAGAGGIQDSGNAVAAELHSLESLGLM